MQAINMNAPLLTASGSQLDQRDNSSVPLALKSQISSTTGFVFPPIYSFPAFFTRQPNSNTFASQSRQWQSLILDYCSKTRIFRMDLSDSTLSRGRYEISGGTSESELWENSKIKRKLRPDFILELIHLMVQAGSAIYDPPLPAQKSNQSIPPVLPAGTGAIILWRSVDEWSQIIYHWVVENGQTNSIMTFFELQDSSSDKEFADLPLPLLKLALRNLIKQNKAQIFQAGDGEGVKFFSAS